MTTRRPCLVIAAVGVLGVLVSLLGVGASDAARGRQRVKLEVYVMSKCRFASTALEKLKPALDALGDRVDLRLDYIATESDQGFSALHGEPEVRGNILQLCTIKHYPARRQHLGFIVCQARSYADIPDGWETCAKEAGLSKDRLAGCADGAQGKELLRDSLKRAAAANAQGSPTFRIADEVYTGGRETNDFLRALCGKLPGARPVACRRLPKEVEVRAIVLTDKRCKTCSTDGPVNNVRARYFAALKVRTLDYGTPAGKKLHRELGQKLLPIIAFEPGVEQASGYATLESWLITVGRYRLLRIPATFDPTAEICDNGIDDNGDGKVDCADPQCQGALECRTLQPRAVAVFVMSQCPFAAKGVTAMKDVLADLRPLSFSIHYIADKTESGFTSLHGQAEVDEDIRQLCARSHYGKNDLYLEYVWCRFGSFRSDDWKACTSARIASGTIERCATGDEGKRLLAGDLKLAQALSISGSPTWLANNKFKFSAITVEDLKREVCKRNATLAGCERVRPVEVAP